MNILVLVKEVPDMERVRFDSERGVVDRSSAKTEINPFDLNALRAAVDLKREFGGEITVLTMGPPGAEKSLRDAYARGADKCILLTDRKFGGADTLATSSTIAAAIKKTGFYDLIICGEKSVDGDTAQVGPEVAELLDIPHSCYVERVKYLMDGEIYVVIEELCGGKQERKMRLPALISVTKNINSPELPTLKRKIESLKVSVDKYTLSELEGQLSEEQTGGKGSPTRVVRIEIPRVTKRESRIYKDENSFIGDIIGVIRRG